MKLQSAKLVVIAMTVGGVVVVGLLFAFLILPTLRDANEVKRRIVEAQTELEAQYENRRNLLSNRAKVAETRELMKALSQQFVPVGRELDFITEIERLAAKNGLNERLQVSKTEGAPAAPEFKNRFDLAFDGPFRPALQMLVDLEKMPTLIVMESMGVRPSGLSDGPPLLTIDVHGFIAVPPQGL